MCLQKFDIVYFSIDKWSSWKKRPAHFAIELSRRDKKVLFVEDAPRFKERICEILKGNTVHLSKLGEYNIWQMYTYIRLPFKFRGGKKLKLWGLNFNHKLLWHFIKKTIKKLDFSDIVVIGQDIYNYPIDEICCSYNFYYPKVLATVYDCTDDYKEFPDADYEFAIRVEESIASKADVVFFTTRTLIERPEMKRVNNAYYIPNGVEYEKFNSPYNYIPPELCQVKENNILFGYVGTISEWRVDFNLLEEILNISTNYTICLVGGFIYDFEKDFLTKKINLLLEKYPNRFLFLGPKPYEELPFYVQNFDVCLIPLKLQEGVRSIVPEKTFEYLAAGKGVISTRWKEMEQFSDIISLVSNKEELKSAVAHEVAFLDDEKLRKKRMDFAKNYDWNKIVKDSVEITSNFIKCKQIK